MEESKRRPRSRAKRDIRGEVAAQGVTQSGKMNPAMVGLRFLQGALIGLGAVLPGISGGVLCVVFGVYRTVMELLSHPVRTIKKQYGMLIPLIIGGAFGFVVIARVLGVLLDKYPGPSVCIFVGLIGGMIPSLFREAGQKGRNGRSFVSLVICFCIIFAVLLGLNFVNLEISQGFVSYVFCGFCIALSIIVPGMSFSTLLMPLDLYTPLVTGIGNFTAGVIVPAAIGALVTVILLAKAADRLMERHYNVAFHGIIGIVVAATIFIIPYESFVAGATSCITDIICLAVGFLAAFLLDMLNKKVDVPGH